MKAEELLEEVKIGIHEMKEAGAKEKNTILVLGRQSHY